jgi:hypothetical protein
MNPKPHHPLVFLFLALFSLQGTLLAIPVRLLAWDDAVAARKIAFQNGTTVVEVADLHPNKRSDALDGGTGGSPLQLVALDRDSKDGKPVAVEIKLAAGILKPLVLILPDPKHPTGLRPFVVEDDATNFGWGTIRFINATGKALLVRHDKTIKKLPAAWTPVDVDPGGEARNTGVQVAMPEDIKSILYSAVWEHDPEIRKLVFVVPGREARTGVVEFKIIPEDRRTLAPAAPPADAPAEVPAASE